MMKMNDLRKKLKKDDSQRTGYALGSIGRYDYLENSAEKLIYRHRNWVAALRRRFIGVTDFKQTEGILKKTHLG